MAATGTAATAGNGGGAGASASGAGGGAAAAAGTPATSTATTKKKATKATGAGTTAKKKVVRKKKVVKKTGDAAHAANPSRAAQMELAAKRNKQAARRNDPLWYKIEDVLPPGQGETEMAASGSILPEQFTIVESALANNDLNSTDVTPQAFACLLEQSRRYALELLADAQDYAYLAGRKEITKADLTLADEMRPDHPVSLATQLPKLNLMAGKLNRVPLPPIPSQCYSGVLLPPKQHQLTARTYDVVSGARVAQRMVQAAPSAPVKKSKVSPSKPSYGANLGRQIPIKLKEAPAAVPAAKKDDGGVAPMDTSTSSPAKEASSASAPAAAPNVTGTAATAPAPAPSAPGIPEATGAVVPPPSGAKAPSIPSTTGGNNPTPTSGAPPSAPTTTAPPPPTGTSAPAVSGQGSSAPATAGNTKEGTTPANQPPGTAGNGGSST